MKKNRKWSTILAGMVCLICFVGCGKLPDQIGNTSSREKECTKELFAMDTYMTFTAYGENAEQGVEDAIAEVNRLDALWSVSSEEGEIYQINKNGTGKVSQDTCDILEQAQELYVSTDGLFDITVYPLMELWGFTTGKYHIPTKEELERKRSLVDQGKLSFSEEEATVAVEKGQQLDLGAIAKGFTSNRIMEIWKQEGITSGMVSLGGNVQVLGTKPDGSSWTIGIKDPEKSNGELVGVVTTRDKAVITSGGYERYFEENGKRYPHILDTRTGAPAEQDLCSVTIVSKDGTLADGLSTSLFVMGKDKAIEYWKLHAEKFDVMLVTNRQEIYVTEGLKKEFSSENKFKIISREE